MGVGAALAMVHLVAPGTRARATEVTHDAFVNRCIELTAGLTEAGESVTYHRDGATSGLCPDPTRSFVRVPAFTTGHDASAPGSIEFVAIFDNQSTPYQPTMYARLNDPTNSGFPELVARSGQGGA